MTMVMPRASGYKWNFVVQHFDTKLQLHCFRTKVVKLRITQLFKSTKWHVLKENALISMISLNSNITFLSMIKAFWSVLKANFQVWVSWWFDETSFFMSVNAEFAAFEYFSTNCQCNSLEILKSNICLLTYSDAWRKSHAKLSFVI